MNSKTQKNKQTIDIINMNQKAEELLFLGYLPLPINKKTKTIKFITEDKKEILCGYKNYNQEKAKCLIMGNYFLNNDLAILLKGDVCVIDIDNDSLTSSEIIFNKMMLKFPKLKKFPMEKTNHGYHSYARDTNKL